jgi:hypothetical protein
MITIITAFILGATSVLSGVALGGFLVYRTKREAGEPLFMKSEPGEAFNLDDGVVFNTPPATAGLPLSKAAQDASERFVEQFVKGLEKNGENS